MLNMVYIKVKKKMGQETSLRLIVMYVRTYVRTYVMYVQKVFVCGCVCACMCACMRVIEHVHVAACLHDYSVCS